MVTTGTGDPAGLGDAVVEGEAMIPTSNRDGAKMTETVMIPKEEDT